MVIPIELVKGFKLAAITAGLKKSGKPDMALILADKPAATAGMFTRSRVCAAPVKVDKKHLKITGGYSRAVLVNSGAANACTGKDGIKDAELCAEHLASKIGAKKQEILVCSTGVIGHRLDMTKMITGIDKAITEAGKSLQGSFARAIMTTDLVPKEASIEVPELNGTISGVCKGSGMIAPNMATMLAYILTDIEISPSILSSALKDVVERTFNSVTVDGDTSTNDTVLCLASGAACNAEIKSTTSKQYKHFRDALETVCFSLAEQIARDGEGATKIVRIKVKGAKSESDAKKAARAIAESPLVKTAMFGCDPNWGRIMMAAGRSGAGMNERNATVRLCGVDMYTNGKPAEFDPANLSRMMKSKDITLEIDLGVGNACRTMLTCDFSYDYVKINAEYHT